MGMSLMAIQHLVAVGRYRYSQKVRTLIEDGWFDEVDLVSCILSATRIHKRERDEFRQGRDNLKYVILGRDTYGRSFYTAGKILTGSQGQVYFFITAHQADAAS
jgi:hypothetical protein